MATGNEGGNLAAVVHKKHDLRLETRKIQEPGDNEVQIRIGSVGVCGSDISLWDKGALGPITVTAPYVPGHECSGVISKVGANVTRFKKGDRVAIEPFKVCRTCDACTKGRYNICETMHLFSAPPCDGALSQYVVHDQNFVFKLPDNMSLDEGALCEPLSVALYACRRAKVCLGDTVLICGAGPIGLCSLLAAKANGASSTIITDLDASRLEMAKNLGATHTLQIAKEDTIEETSKKLITAIGRTPTKAIDCTGIEAAVQVAIEVLQPGGILTLVGLGSANINVPLVNIVLKEIDLIPSCIYTRTWPTAIEMISSGRCNVAPLVTHRFNLNEAQKAFDTAKSGAGIKVVVNCNPE